MRVRVRVRVGARVRVRVRVRVRERRLLLVVERRPPVAQKRSSVVFTELATVAPHVRAELTNCPKLRRCVARPLTYSETCAVAIAAPHIRVP